jgi:hypothetical protein
MKDEIIDLISDGEDSCCEEPEDINAHLSARDQKKESTSTSASNVTVVAKPQDENASHTAENAAKFLSSLPDRSTCQGKQITRKFWKAGDYEVTSSTVSMLPSITSLFCSLLEYYF